MPALFTQSYLFALSQQAGTAHSKKAENSIILLFLSLECILNISQQTQPLSNSVCKITHVSLFMQITVEYVPLRQHPTYKTPYSK